MDENWADRLDCRYRNAKGRYRLHIAIFLDQNPGTLGGAQASVVLQKKYLELAGHRVTICAPHGDFPPAPGVLTYPSLPLTLNREFAFTLQASRAIRHLNRKFASIADTIDIVHVQADNWGAAIGVRFAREHNLPLVNTLHTNLEYAVQKILGKRIGQLSVLALSTGFALVSKVPGLKSTKSAWRYLRQISKSSQMVFAPSLHFAQLAMNHGVATKIHPLSNGVDDKFATIELPAKPKKTAKDAPKVSLLWCGRVSDEKRIMPFLKAVDLAAVDCDVRVYGTGSQLAEAEAFVAKQGLSDRVKFLGRVSHNDMLLEMKEVDVLVQTSVGFETQGMTVYEAGVMGTPSVICDHNIAADLPDNSYWLVEDESVAALAKAIKTAVWDVKAGNPKHIDLRSQMLQSKLSERTLELYRQAIKLHAAGQKDTDRLS